MIRIDNVRFLCTGNAAGPIMAEAIPNREGMGRFKAFSAGSCPKGEVHPYAYDFLAGLHDDMSFTRSRGRDDFARTRAPDLDFAFTVCDRAAEVCPAWPGQPTSARWGGPDSAAVGGSEAERRFAFADMYRMPFSRNAIFVNLPIASLDVLTRQKQLEENGQRQEDAAQAAPA